MRGVILAAGRGARLSGGRNDMPKCLVTLGGETLLSRNVRTLRAAGIEDVTIVVGCAADTVRRSCPGVAFVDNSAFAQTNSLYSLWLARPQLTDGFVVMNCDVLAHPQLIVDLLTTRHEDALLLSYRGPDTTYGKEEMKVRVRCGRVADISKALDPDEADGENLGIVKFGAAGARVVIEEMEAIVAGGDMRSWAPHAFQRFARRRPLHVVGTRGLPWTEIDFPEDYRYAIEQVLPDIESDLSSSGAVAPLLVRMARTA